MLTVGASDRSNADRRLLEPLALRRPRRPGRRHPDRDGDRQGLARRRRDELRGPARLRRERVGLDGAPGARRDAAVRGDAPLRRRHRRAGTRRRGRLRAAQRSRRARLSAPRSADPFEPNDDIEFVRPGGLYDNSIPPLTTPVETDRDRPGARRPRRGPARRLPGLAPEGPHDHGDATADTNLDLSLWKQGTVSVIERIVGNDRLARATVAGNTEKLTFANKGAGRFAYLAVVFGKGGARGQLDVLAGARCSWAPALGDRHCRVLDGRVEHDVRLAHAHADGANGESRHERVGERRREGLEQVVRAARRRSRARGRRPPDSRRHPRSVARGGAARRSRSSSTSTRNRCPSRRSSSSTPWWPCRTMPLSSIVIARPLPRSTAAAAASAST